jgi:DNA-binding response OmpR family regulator
MVVDDEKDQLFTIEQSLKNANRNFEIILSDSGMDCLKKLKNDIIPDIILLDIMMPDMNGWELQKRIKSSPKFKDIPIVFLTARDDEMAKKAGRFLGEDFIEKPYTTQDLIQRINKILDKNKE